jgi:hypothetical protein
VDTANVDPLTARVDLSMELGDGSSWPLGRNMFTDLTKIDFTSGQLSNAVLNDEMFLVDQEIIVGYDAAGQAVTTAYLNLLQDFNFGLDLAGTAFTMSQSWGVGTSRGSILESLAVAGDCFSPWFGNDKKMHLIRSFNPAMQVPQFDWDSGNQVLRSNINETSNVLTAPNRFVVISNTGASSQPIVGVANVPPTAPNSFANRGFYITDTQTLQLTDDTQASAVATGLANRGTLFETTTLDTALDPRHDSYDVVRWKGSLWLELAWSMQLTPGGRMSHTIRKGYAQ